MKDSAPGNARAPARLRQQKLPSAGIPAVTSPIATSLPVFNPLPSASPIHSRVKHWVAWRKQLLLNQKTGATSNGANKSTPGWTRARDVAHFGIRQ